MKLYPILFEAKTLKPKLTDKTITIDEVQQHFDHFHLSSKFLGQPTFTFTPRIPPEPFMDGDSVVEDDFTKRISLAPTINNARDAIKDYGATYYYVYAVEDQSHIKRIADNIDDCPKNPPKRYGEKFKLIPWLKKNEPEELETYKAKKGHLYNMAPSRLTTNVKTQFKGCVPDAEETQEEWSTKPLTMTFIGTINNTDNVLTLSPEGAQIMGLYSDT